MTLVHSYIQVTARSIDYILLARASGVSMWKQLVKVLQLKYPTISYTNKLYEGNKNIVNSNFTSPNAKIASQNQTFFRLWWATNLASLGKLLRSYLVTIIRTLDAKFREKSTCRFKINTRNLTNFDLSTRKF